MQFTRLRLTGFKSFVDQTELLIEPGLTGIVGPNGCGKSNLVEALRWVMGETSARRMRGTEMEDVIFGGTATRPARNIAEVVLTLHNSNRTAPPAFNHHEFLDITRRIERGTGSDYRINGKNVRARDVQILFADHASGATSPALVSQGRVSAVINAKPAQRRDILEEAAGIGGLHARRHEAELRLKGAESNLERVEDILKTMNTQLEGLQKQAKQAARYRALNDTIRHAEALLLHARWQALQQDQAAARRAFDAAEHDVRHWLAQVTQAQTAHLGSQEDLPQLRKNESETAQKVERLKMVLERLDDALKQNAAALQQLEQRLIQGQQDLARASQIDADAQTAINRLQQERQQINQARYGEEERITKAEGALKAIHAEITRRETSVTDLTEQIARAEADTRAARQRVDERRQRVQTVQRQEQQLRQQQQELTERARQLTEHQAIEEQARTAEQDVVAAQQDLQRLEEDMAAAQAHLERNRQQKDDDQLALRRLRQDIDALEKTLKASEIDPRHKPVIEHLNVASGYEIALAAALAEGLEAGLDPAAGRHWHELGANPISDIKPVWPENVTPLDAHVTATPVLMRALSHIGVVGDDAVMADLAAALHPGQILVNRQGDVWRWDGLVSKATMAGRAAQRLEQKNRLRQLMIQLAPLQLQASTSQQDCDHAQQQRDEVRQREQQTRQHLRHVMNVADQSRRQSLAALQARADLDGRINANTQRLQELTQELGNLATELLQAEHALGLLPDLSAGRGALESERKLLAETRQEDQTARQNHERLHREAHGRRKRLDHIEQEISDWQQRRAQADQHVADLNQRQQMMEQEKTSLSARPSQIDAERSSIMDQAQEAEILLRRQRDQLHQAETLARQAETALKEAEQKTADAREARARAETGVSLARQAMDALVTEIREKLDAIPEQTLTISGHPPEKSLPAIPDLEQKWQKLLRERDNMGAVNLRADEESAELDNDIRRMINDRDDLLAAISRLRQGIGRLNKEAREKLLDAFTVVNRHFQDLFVRLFGGGRAHLALTEADDPLEAGLEIYASPPGKKLQHLSLLSGGEQALTAVALIFSVFLTNPSPICVLDEVDAPLDEANVDRFCGMLDEMARTTGTRFLIISHHRLTMARMDRLFGVTMSERGISKLVSVDLATAAEIPIAV